MTVIDAPPDQALQLTATALRPASATAERERARLAQRADRSGVAGIVAGLVPGLRRLGSEEAAVNGLRYRPVAWTVIALVAASFYLPGRIERAAPPQVAASPPAVTPAPPGRPAEPVGATPVAGTPRDPSSTFTPPPVAPFDPAPPRQGTGASVPPPTAPGPSAPPTEAPLVVRGGGWASRLPATPLPSDEVPDGTFPVANRLGSVDRVSFLRLSGDGSALVLVEDADAAREALGPGAVAACPIEDEDWAEEPEQSFDDAPTWREDACVAGVESDGRWTFDLSSFADRTGDAGFALVPTVDAPADFQVGFRAG